MRDSAYTAMRSVEAVHWWFVARRNILREVLRHRLPARRLSILEAGCGTGGNLGLLGEFGDVSAFEPMSVARQAASASGLADIRQGALPDGVPFEQTFDLVCAFDVIEHVDDDVGSCAALLGRLKADGLAVFTVPAFQFLWSGHDEVLHHKRRYTRRNFVAVLERAGFQVSYSTYFNTFLFPLVAGVRLAQRLLGRSHEGDDTDELPSPRLNKLLEAVFASERWLLTWLRLPIGVSILCVARPSAAAAASLESAALNVAA